MTDDARLLDELQALRREIDGLRATRDGAPACAAADTAAAGAAAADGAAAEETPLLESLLGLVAEAEATVRAHPAATVAGAFAAGVLLGRLLAKG